MDPDDDDVVLSRIECRAGACKTAPADDYQKRIDQLFMDNRRILRAVQREAEMMDRAVPGPVCSRGQVRHTRQSARPWPCALFFCC